MSSPLQTGRHMVPMHQTYTCMTDSMLRCQVTLSSRLHFTTKQPQWQSHALFCIMLNPQSEV